MSTLGHQISLLARRATILTIVGGLLLFLKTFPAIAATTCRTYDHHRICLVSVKRSAKNYWEYRAVVEIDGDRRPMERYDCKAKRRTTVDGVRIPFEPQGAGSLICQLLYR